MAKKSKKAKKAKQAQKASQPKLTDQDRIHIERLFSQVRDQALQQWYKQAQDGPANIKASAQARLQLQIWLRDSRRSNATFKAQRRDFMHEGNTVDMGVALKKEKMTRKDVSELSGMIQNGIPHNTATKARQEWARMDLPLEFVLADFSLDNKSDFGVNRDSIGIPVEFLVRNCNLPHHITPTTFSPEDRVDEIKLEDETDLSTLDEAIPDPTSIWAQHTLHIQRRYRFADLPDWAVETKLAFQKKVFEHHVEREHQLRTALDITTEFTKNWKLYPLRERLRMGVDLSIDSTLRTSSPSEHSIWELTSPMLWQHFEDGLSWDSPQWFPKGLMRIQSSLIQSSIYFEFGTHSFSVDQVQTPAVFSTKTFHYQARCHQTGKIVDTSITFLVQGIVRVKFPALDIIVSDLGCMHLPLTTVELTGIWMGSCRMIQVMEYCMW